MKFPINNRPVIRRLTKGTMKANKVRNIFVIIAIALTAFLLSTIFSIGKSGFESIELMRIRTVGTVAHIDLINPTQKQIAKIKSLDYVKDVGLTVNAGDIIETPDMGNMSLSLSWLDKTEWEKHRIPAVSHINGKYPQADNEIMIPDWILKRMGITKPQIGMDISVTYKTVGSETPISRKFKLSAYYTEYINLRSGNTGNMYVSKAFFQKEGTDPELAGYASTRFESKKDIETQMDKLRTDITVSGTQKWSAVPLYNNSYGSSAPMVIGLSGLIFFIMLSSYLLIYNVLYISISKDVRFYGLLKTIGTTPRQIRKIVMGQAIRLAAVGIPLGLVMGAAVSFVAVPFALSGASIDTGIKVSFNPIIYVGAAVFSLITTLISSIKPAGKAASITPIEAVRYTGTSVSGKLKKSLKGGKLQKMALRNVFRSKRRAAVVFLSLFMGITTFMLVNTLVLSMDIDNYVKSYVKNDFTLSNDTAYKSPADIKQKFDDKFMASVEKMQGITVIRKILQKQIVLNYDEKLYGDYVKEFTQRLGTPIPTGDEIQKNPGIFWTNLVGLDTEYIEELNKTLANPIDTEAFKRGEIALFSTDNPNLFKSGSEVVFTVDQKDYSIKLGGILPEKTAFRGPMGLAPNVYISNDAMRKLFKDPIVYTVTIDAKDGAEAAILKQLKEMRANDNEITLDSRLDTLDQFRSSRTMLYILGAGLSLILALIGILNFVNVMVMGINARRHEFAVVESIGMTAKQVKRMISFEGLIYAVISFGLVATLGVGINIWVFSLFKKQADYAIFTFPTIPLTLSFVIISAVCVFVPVIAYKSSSRDTVTERLRSVEG